MKRLSTFLSTLLLITALFGQADTLSRSFVHNDSLRSYLLYVPAAYDGSEDWPLVINLHGYAITAEMQMVLSNMNPVADTGRFLVVYPQGTTIISTVPGIPPQGFGWNISYPGDTSLFVSRGNVDDVGFISELIDEIGENYHLDFSRVYATGWSNGGSMSNVLACELSERIAAIAPVGGTPVRDRPCNPERQVPVLQIHGTQDPVISYDAGDPTGNIVPVEEFLDFWININGCSPEPTVNPLPDLTTEDTSTVELLTWSECGAELLHYKVVNGGHNWPGGVNIFPFLGYFNRDINASSEIWNFFNRNPHPNPPGRVLEKSFVHNDSLRSYLLYVPYAYDSAEDWPLVINFHQFGFSPGDYMAHTGMNTVADTAHFLIAYPQGLNVTNPVSGQQGAGWNESENLSTNDDVGFTATLISEISASFPIDPGRIYATGWGMGAGFAQKAQCALADIIAATASVCGPLTDLLLQTCTPDRPLSMLFMQGTADPFIPYDPDPQHPITTMGIAGSIDFLQVNNNCSADSTITEIADTNTEDGSTVTLIEYGPCDAETEIVVYRINGGGHAWPGGGALPEFFGPVNRDINASSEIWNFFNRNPHPDLTTSTEEVMGSIFEQVKIYPNPSYGEMTIEFELKQTGKVQLGLFTVLGQSVGSTVNQYFSAGKQRFTWSPNVDQLSPGLYLLRINSGNEILTQAVMIHTH